MNKKTDKKIKIFVDAHSFDTELQGTQTFIRELYTAILKAYPGIEIYFGAYRADLIRNAFPDLDEKQILPYKNGGIRRMFSDIPGFIKKHDFDYAHFQYIAPRQINGCKYIVTLHDVMYQERPEDFSLLYAQVRRILFSRSFKKAYFKTTVSHHSRRSISRYLRTPESEICIIPNAVNDAFSKNFASRKEAVVYIKEHYGIDNFILFVSRFEPRKNHLLLLKKYIQLELYKKEIPLVFIGKKSIEVPEFNLLVGSLSQEQKKYIHFLSDIPQVDLVGFYGSCRLFVYPSKGEGFGIPPLEAAFCGAPVLCSNASAMRDFDFFEPYTFNPDSEHEFEEKLTDMINHPVSEEFIQKVRHSIRNKYCWQKSASHFCEMLQSGSL